MKLFFTRKTTQAMIKELTAEAELTVEAMSLDELIDWKLEKKRQIEVLRDELRQVQPIYNQKVELWHARAALDRAGLTGITLEPGPAELKVEPGPAELKVEGQ